MRRFLTIMIIGGGLLWQATAWGVVYKCNYLDEELDSDAPRELIRSWYDDTQLKCFINATHIGCEHDALVGGVKRLHNRSITEIGTISLQTPLRTPGGIYSSSTCRLLNPPAQPTLKNTAVASKI